MEKLGLRKREMADPTPEEQEEMLKQIELLQLQEKRMKALVAQRREERREMDLENSRMERQLKFMKEMAAENEEAERDVPKEVPTVKPPETALRNQFNYSERASQTFNNPYRVSRDLLI